MKTNTSRVALAYLGCIAAFSISLNAQTSDSPQGNTSPAPIENPSAKQNADVPSSITKPTPVVSGGQTTITAGQAMTVGADETTKTGTTTGVTAIPLSNDDQRFVGKASGCGEYEIALSRQASTSATHAQVRTYAASIVKQHEKMSTELLTLATRRGVTLASEGKHLDDLASLSKKTGTKYDEAYLEDMIEAHDDAISLFEKASKSKDTDVAAFAVQYLPALKDHLAQAKQLTKLVK